MSKPLVFIDTETGGLTTDRALIEVAWATLEEPEPQVLRLPHDTDKVDEIAAQVNHYAERGLGDPSTWCTQEQITAFLTDLEGATLVGANIAFDAGFIQYHLCPVAVPWHYRMLDIESMAYGVLGMPDVPGMKAVYDELTTRGYAIPQPDHTAAGDVRSVLAMYKVLRYL